MDTAERILDYRREDKGKIDGGAVTFYTGPLWKSSVGFQIRLGTAGIECETCSAIGNTVFIFFAQDETLPIICLTCLNRSVEIANLDVYDSHNKKGG